MVSRGDGMTSKERAAAAALIRRAAAPEEQRAVTGPDEWGSVYVHFQPARRGEHGAVAKTMRIEHFVNFDYDKNGKLYGIELLDVRSDMNVSRQSEGK